MEPAQSKSHGRQQAPSVHPCTVDRTRRAPQPGPAPQYYKPAHAPGYPVRQLSMSGPAGSQHTTEPKSSAQSSTEPLVTPCRSPQLRLLSICQALASLSSTYSRLASCPGQLCSSQRLGRTLQHPLQLDTLAAQLQAFTMLHNRVPMPRSCKHATWQQLRLRGHTPRHPAVAGRRRASHSSNRYHGSSSKCCYSSRSLPSSTWCSTWPHSRCGQRSSSTPRRFHSRSSSTHPP